MPGRAVPELHGPAGPPLEIRAGASTPLPDGPVRARACRARLHEAGCAADTEFSDKHFPGEGPSWSGRRIAGVENREPFRFRANFMTILSISDEEERIGRRDACTRSERDILRAIRPGDPIPRAIVFVFVFDRRCRTFSAGPACDGGAFSGRCGEQWGCCDARGPTGPDPVAERRDGGGVPLPAASGRSAERMFPAMTCGREALRSPKRQGWCPGGGVPVPGCGWTILARAGACACGSGCGGRCSVEKPLRSRPGLQC